MLFGHKKAREEKKMKRRYLILGIVIIAVIGIYFLFQLFTPREYYCGHQRFGGFVGASSQDACEKEWAIIVKYKPICEKLAARTEVEWEATCWNVLRNPEAICNENMLKLGVELSEEEKAECLAEVDSIQKLI